MLLRVVALLVWIGLWGKFRIYRVPLDQVTGSCQFYGYIWHTFIIICIQMPNKGISVSHKNQCHDNSYVMLTASVVDFKYQPCGIFKGLLFHQ